MAKQLTIRGVSDEVAERLKRLSADRGQSLNATVLDILERSVDANERRSHLQRYVTWTDGDLDQFRAALSAQRVVDDELWE